MSDLVKNEPFQEVAKKGAAIYEKIRIELEPQENGKYLAIEPESGKYYLGITGVESLEKARTAHPGNIFYVVKVGHESAETLSQTMLG